MEEKLKAVEEKAKVLSELKELGWEPPAGVNPRILNLQNRLKKMKEDRFSLVQHDLGHPLESYTVEELKNFVKEWAA